MKAFPYIKINVFAIRNDFFGETVTVSGLITGQDLKAQLLEKKASGTDLGDTLLITCNMLRTGISGRYDGTGTGRCIRYDSGRRRKPGTGTYRSYAQSSLYDAA